MTTLSGSEHAIVRGAFSFKSSRTKCSSICRSITPWFLEMPVSYTKSTNSFRGISPAAQTRNRRHPWIIPAIHMSFIYKQLQLPLTCHRWTDSATKFILMRYVFHLTFGYNPIVEWTLILKLQGTERMRYTFNRIF